MWRKSEEWHADAADLALIFAKEMERMGEQGDDSLFAQ
jgi:hypothetical protein